MSDTATQEDFAAFESAENAKALGQEPPKADAPAAEPAPNGDEPDAEDEPAETLASEPEPEKAAAPVPTPEKPVSKRQQQINELIRARAESDQRAADLAAKLAEIESRVAKPSEKAEPAAAPTAPLDPSDPEPTEDEIGTKFSTYAEFTRAQARWVVREERRAEAIQAQQESAQRAQSERLGTWTQRLHAFADSKPDKPSFVKAVGPFLDLVKRDTPLYDVLTDSPVGPAIAEHLATHPEVWSRIAPLGPIQQLRALGAIEALFDSSLTSASASAGPAAKTVTTAPAPPTTLSARSADPADPVAAAVARGDFSAFEAEENRRLAVR